MAAYGDCTMGSTTAGCQCGFGYTCICHANSTTTWFVPSNTWANWEPIYEFAEKLTKAITNHRRKMALLAKLRISPLPQQLDRHRDASLRQWYRRIKAHAWPSLNERRMAWGFK